MNEKKVGLTITGAIVLLSISILVSSFQIAGAIREASRDEKDSDYYYEIQRFNDNFEELIINMQKENEGN